MSGMEWWVVIGLGFLTLLWIVRELKHFYKALMKEFKEDE